MRDPDSTSFVGAIEPAYDFGWRIYGGTQEGVLIVQNGSLS